MTTTNGKRSPQEKAYAPYSKFKVGTAILLDGEIILGSNQENAASLRTMRREVASLRGWMYQMPK
jgi:cytidine deaminase